MEPQKTPPTPGDIARQIRAQQIAGLPALKAAGAPSGACFYKPKAESTRIRAIAWGYPASGADLLAKLTGENKDAEPKVAPLTVIFASGAPWQYDGVPAFKALGLLYAESAGKYFGGEILNNPAYKQLKLIKPEPANAPAAGMLPPPATPEAAKPAAP